MKDYNLDRFIENQKYDFDIALKEVRSGKKRSHWMWYIFPQLKGLGQTYTAMYYGIESIEEARAYMENDYLRANLIAISRALLALDETNPSVIFGFPDYLKLRSCMTLFELASPEAPEFASVLEKFYNGQRDEKTIRLLNEMRKEY